MASYMRLKRKSIPISITSFLPLAVFLLGIFLLAANLDLKPLVGDEGVLAMDAWRINQGQVPQRDFFELIPPVAAYVQAAVFYILGPSVLSLRLLGALYGVALLVLAWVAGRLYLKNPLFISLPLALLIPFGVGVWPFASHHWLADIFLLAALLALDRAFNAHSPSKNEIFTTKTPRHQEGFFRFAGWPWRGFTTKAQRAQREEKGKKEAHVRQATRPDSFLDAGHGEKRSFTTEENAVPKDLVRCILSLPDIRLKVLEPVQERIRWQT
jgi:hypothetical protein